MRLSRYIHYYTNGGERKRARGRGDGRGGLDVVLPVRAAKSARRLRLAADREYKSMRQDVGSKRCSTRPQLSSPPVQ